MAENKYVIFRLDTERYGIPIEAVERILPTQPVTKLPKTPKMFVGIFELRGSTIPTIDARLRFEMSESDNARNFVVVLTELGRCAMRVDEVVGIITFDETEIDDSPHLTESRGDDFIQAIGKKGDQITVLLEANNIVPKALRATVAAQNKEAVAA
ncbi:MAG: purine-binding chemotaxis protein CheW [Fimbriimonadaceae bacterium]|nr:purine-binding chemotaxis protein CheW [Fimbriimonadaceae bacterium]